MVIILSVILTILFMLLLGCLAKIKKLQDEMTILSKEQHTQNLDILDLLKFKGESIGILIQHSDVLKYLAEEDAKLSRSKIKYKGIVGKA